MIRAAILFFILALASMILGAGEIAGASMEAGQSLMMVFLILAAISFVAGIVSGRNPDPLP